MVSTSSIGRKLVMSISGVFLVLFLLFHSLMNLVVIISPESYNAICGFLGANWYALAGTAVLAGGFAVHILMATWLTWQNRRARGSNRYAVTGQQDSVSWASKNMFVLGLVVVGFLALHFYNFWYKMQFVELTGIGNHELAADGAYWVTQLFSQWYYCLIYIIWIVALWFHLTHSVWSALQTLGLSNTKWLTRIKVIGNIGATIVCLLFVSVPVYFLITNLFL
ncbi:MAG: succinate dehydrogenase cytochrome b subunit [Prevotellaceae bacterium]|jgi:succinate dehydrogenase / fumarate reductase cytochrome b subunit|nr:succinate dehydrogenase cytochrome b subunit [Prevotellaceae bacterium]